ncbi:MAG: ABC transporter ATP-binding protein [Acidobacteria bacterium]|nr:ABC transporter ATP-binding protein [Acidobacteriota bacterium]MCI0718396.1 ABC transporter ATP-binding protein [Acidobacteriota bacterium]
MTSPVFVENLSKQYRIGAVPQETMLREKLVSLLKHPFRRKFATEETIWALRNVSMSVQSGEVVGIIGRNGAGKSTLLKVLSRITRPTSGMVRVRGRVASLLEVGTGFHEELTGRENIFLNGSILGMKKSEIEDKLDAIIAFAGVEKFIETPIKRYSSGMRLRLGFAVAAHLDPDVLIVDEVLAVGDAGFQKKCLNVMEDLRQGGRTVLFVSHNMVAVENLCSRGVWIDNGQVEMDGPAKDVIRAYMGAFANSHATELSAIKTRRGSGEIRYTGVEFLAKDGQPQNITCSGDALIMRFRYHAEKPIPYPSFGFRLFTELGSLVTETSTWHHGIDIPLAPPGDGWIDLEIGLLNLLPAHYYLSLWLTGEGEGRVIYDCLEHCTRLEVEASSVYQSSRVIDSRHGIVFFPQRWKLDGLQSAPRDAILHLGSEERQLE